MYVCMYVPVLPATAATLLCYVAHVTLAAAIKVTKNTHATGVTVKYDNYNKNYRSNQRQIWFGGQWVHGTHSKTVNVYQIKIYTVLYLNFVVHASHDMLGNFCKALEQGWQRVRFSTTTLENSSNIPLP